jgi:hypothetical protein
VAFAASKGYEFTIEEAKQYAKARAAAKGEVLTDAELDGVAGGRDSEGGCTSPYRELR